VLVLVLVLVLMVFILRNSCTKACAVVLTCWNSILSVERKVCQRFLYGIFNTYVFLSSQCTLECIDLTTAANLLFRFKCMENFDCK